MPGCGGIFAVIHCRPFVMSDVLIAFARACRDLWHPRMLAVALLPMLAALGAWLVLAFFYWSAWTQALDAWINTSAAGGWVAAHAALDVGRYAAWILLVLVLVPLVFATASLLASLLAMPLIVGFVAARDYPRLERLRGGSFAGSLFNGLFAVTAFVLLWMLTLPLWLTAVLGPPVAVALSAWLNQRLFRYDALAEHASADELRGVIAGARGSLFLLGFPVALLYTIPFVNLFVPVIGGLAFTHFLLARLAAERASGIVIDA